jgi:hypothetical protein
MSRKLTRQTLNDDRFDLFGESGRAIAFICECTEGDCRSTVQLSADEYRTLRPGAILHPGHVTEDAASGSNLAG